MTASTDELAEENMFEIPTEFLITAELIDKTNMLDSFVESLNKYQSVSFILYYCLSWH